MTNKCSYVWDNGEKCLLAIPMKGEDTKCIKKECDLYREDEDSGDNSNNHR